MESGSGDRGLTYQARLYAGRAARPRGVASGERRPLPEGTVTGDGATAPGSHILGCNQLVFIDGLVPSDLGGQVKETWHTCWPGRCPTPYWP